MKVGLICDEAYPVLRICDDESPNIEVPDKLWNDFVEAERHYEKLHAQVLSLYNDQMKLYWETRK